VGKENVSLYDGSGFSGVSICLDTGKIATANCKKDIRGGTRTSFASCYGSDISGSACDQHVLVDYCVTGGGVATEYCKKFEDVKIDEVALLKLSKEEVAERKAARNVGLESEHLLDSYVWYTDGDWHGFDNDAQKNVKAPYIVCPEHTKEAWEELEEEKRKEEEEKKKQEEEEKRKEEEEKKKQEEEEKKKQEANKATEPSSR